MERLVLVTKKPSSLAFSIIEVLIAMALFSMMAMVGVTAVLHANSMSNLAKEKLQALSLAEEGTAAVRSIKRQNWSALSALDCSQGCALDRSSGVWQLSSGAEVLGKYTRQVFIDPGLRNEAGILDEGGSDDDINIKRVSVKIDWQFNDSRSESLSSSSYLAHYEAPIFQSFLPVGIPFNEGFGNSAWGYDLEFNIYGADWTSGVLSSALKFDNNYLQLNTDSDLLSNSALTIILWVKPNNTSDKQSYIAKGDGGNYNYLFGQDGRRLFFSLGDADGLTVESSNSISRDQWQQVAVAVSGATVNFFVNGNLVGTETLSQSISGLTGNVYIGNELTNNWSFSGILDEIQIYFENFSATQVSDIYSEQLALSATSILWWPFNESSGNLTTDLVAGKTATIYGSTNWIAGLKSNALLFDGSSTYLLLNDVTDTLKTMINSQGTVSFWVKIDRQLGTQYLFDAYDSKSNGIKVEYDVAQVQSSDRLRFIFDDYSVDLNAGFAGDNNWHQIALSWNSGTDSLQAYLDGQAFGSTVNISGLKWNPKLSAVCLGTICPGANNNQPGNLLKGSIDQIEFFDVYLDASKIGSNYQLFIN